MTAQHKLFSRASYFTSAHEPAQLPQDGGTEVAIAGRSNSGKSSLINRLCRQKALARTGRTPGVTRQLVFFHLDEDRYLVDLPGYGYARVGGDLKRHWQGLIRSYLERRRALAGLVIVMDIRHPLKDADLLLMEFALARGLPIHLVLTKADKLGHGRKTESLRGVRQAVGDVASIQTFSATTGEGLDELEKVMTAWLEQDARAV